jgi:hypothetical protein
VNLRRPTAGAVANQQQLLDLLASFYDALIELRRPIQPSRAPALKAISVSTFAQLRAAAGDVNGESGACVALVAGKTGVNTGAQGAFAWDPTATAADDDANILQVAGVSVGRWRRAL